MFGWPLPNKVVQCNRQLYSTMKGYVNCCIAMEFTQHIFLSLYMLYILYMYDEHGDPCLVVKHRCVQHVQGRVFIKGCQINRETTNASVRLDGPVKPTFILHKVVTLPSLCSWTSTACRSVNPLSLFHILTGHPSKS